MWKLQVELLGLIVLTVAQDLHHPAILTDARYLAGDGTFGAAYTQEDGVQFKEVSDANGDRRGSYSYVDPTGHRRTVEYTAGKNGFQPIGEGIPKVTLPTPPPSGYEPIREYNSHEYRSQPDIQEHSELQSSPNSYQYPAEQQFIRESIYQSPPMSAPQLAHASRYLDEHATAEYKPRSTHFQTVRKNRILATFNSPRVLHQYQSQVHPPQRPETQYNPTIDYSLNVPSQSEYRRDLSEYRGVTSPSTQKIHSPGKLDFTRTLDGFSYVFIKS